MASGQTLQDIAGQQGVSLAALWAYNDLTTPLEVGAGQILKIPPADYKPAELKYRVLSGDNLTAVAHMFGSSVAAIVSRNGLASANQIYANQVLTIPLP